MLLTVHTKPCAKEAKLEWVDEDTVKAFVREPPENGKANKALVELLSKQLNVKRGDIKILRGLTARIKQVEITKNTA